MTQELSTYLNNNNIPFHVEGDIIHINNKTYQESYSTNNSFFDYNFHFVGSEIDADNYLYKFGSWWFTLPKGQEKAVKLTRFIYEGKAQLSMGEQVGYLGVHGSCELCNSVGKYSDWATKASFLGCKYLGLTETNSLSGVHKFYTECQNKGIKPIIGMAIFIRHYDDVLSVKLFAKNSDGYNNLLQINKILVESGAKSLSVVEFESFRDNLYVIVDPKKYPFGVLDIKPDYYQLDTVIFDNNRRDKLYLENLKKYYSSNIPPIYMCDSYYLEKEYAYILRHLNIVGKKELPLSKNQQFKDIDTYFVEILSLFSDDDMGTDKALSLFELSYSNMISVCENCNFELPRGNRYLPEYHMTEDQKTLYADNEDMLWNLAIDGLVKRPNLLDNYTDDEIISRIQKEFDVIKQGDVVDYFLILWDIIEWCNTKGILVGYGRGSGCGSLIAYLIGLTNINPLDYDLLFERFLNVGRVKSSLPDLDTDFDSKYRGLVKNYMEERYGSHQVCSVGVYQSFQLKQAIKDLCRLRGLSSSTVNFITTTVIKNEKNITELFALAVKDAKLKQFIKQYPDVIYEIDLILEQQKAEGIHACATIIFPDKKDMFSWTPIRKMSGMYVSEWEGGELDSSGFLKEDILGLEQLDKFDHIIKLIKKNKGVDINIHDIPLDNEKVYDFFCKGLNSDVIHFGSKGLTEYCQKLQPRNIDDLIDTISLYRPGAIENGFHETYVKCKHGRQKVEYYVGTEDIMGNTYGVFVYQEQIMRLCQKLGGLSLVEADDVRKAMGKKKLSLLHSYKERFIKHYCENFGVEEDYADNFWQAIEKASTYLFNKSHAAAYATTGYACQWLKVNYPLEYWSVTFSFAKKDNRSRYIAEINDADNGCKILQPDINKSSTQVVSDTETGNMYWSLTSIAQVGDKAGDQLFKERESFGEYFGFSEFLDRNVFKGSKITKSVIENMIVSGVFDELEQINEPKDRKRLIDEYYSFAKVKIKEDNIFLSHKSNLNWWWTLLQKKKSGYGFFDYNNIIEQYGEDNLKRFPIVEMDRVLSSDFAKYSMVTIAGFVQSCDVKVSKKGSRYATILLEHNYKFIEITVFGEHFAEHAELLEKCKGNILIVNGRIVQGFKGDNVLQFGNDTEPILLTV